MSCHCSKPNLETSNNFSCVFYVEAKERLLEGNRESCTMCIKINVLVSRSQHRKPELKRSLTLTVIAEFQNLKFSILKLTPCLIPPTTHWNTICDIFFSTQQLLFWCATWVMTYSDFLWAALNWPNNFALQLGPLTLRFNLAH